MKQLLLALLLGTSLIVIADTAPAYAQSTEQTDQSEEDWRKSRKKRTTQDIFEDILNPRNTGTGSGYGPPNPIESLPEDSRRHLMKERAKVIATSDPGTTPNTPYNPSDDAKSDPDLQELEKEAWEEIVKDLQGPGIGSGSSDDGKRPGDQGSQGDPSKVAETGQRGSQAGGSQGGNQSPSQSGSGQSGSGQNGQNRSGYQGPSPLRGGSSASVADILAKIKGLQPRSGYGGGSGRQPGQGGTGNGIGTTPGGFGQNQTGPLGIGGGGSQGQAGQGQGSQGQGNQGQGAQGQGSQGQNQGQGNQSQGSQGQGNQGQGSQGQSQGQGQQSANGQSGNAQSQGQQQGQQSAQGQSQGQSQSQAQGQQSSQGQQSADGENDSAQQAASQSQNSSQSQSNSQSQSDAQQAQANAQAQATAEAQARARARAEQIGPLERIKRNRAESTGSGRRTSASDFLKKKTSGE